MEVNKQNNPDFEPGFWDANELTIIMTLIATIFPNILDLISLMEKYHPRTSLRLMLARIFVLNLLNLYTLFIALYNKQNDLLDSLEKLQTNLTATSNCSSQVTTQVIGLLEVTTSASTFPDQSTASIHLGPDNSSNVSGTYNQSVCTTVTQDEGTIASLCWETMIGQEVFKLTVTDMVFVVGQILLIDVFRTFFIKYANNLCCWDLEKTFPEYPDFKTAENLLHLISNQGTIWSNNFYYSLLLIMLFLCMLPPLFAIVAVEPSPYCGPFSGSAKIYHVLTRTMTEELPASVSAVIEYAASPGVILPVFMLLGMTIYYLLSVGQSLRDVNNDLKLQLEYERTEGRKKVYAMADAKHEATDRAKGKGWAAAKTRFLSSQNETGGRRDLASTVHSLVKAVRASREMTDMGRHNPPDVLPKPGREGGRGGEGDGGEGGRNGMTRRTMTLLQKLQQSQRVQPAVPVAVIEGKQSVKAVRERDTNEVKSIFRQALLAHAKKQKSLEGQDENTNKISSNGRSEPRNQSISTRTHPKSRHGNYQNNSSAQKSSRGKGDHLDRNTRGATNYVKSRRLTDIRNSDDRSKSKQRKVRVEVHGVSDGRETQNDSPRNSNPRKSRSTESGVRRKDNSTENVVRWQDKNTKETDFPARGNARPRKLLRRLSSSSVIDETGHLKVHDESSSDDDDDDDVGDDDDYSADERNNDDDDEHHHDDGKEDGDDDSMIDHMDENEENEDEMSYSDRSFGNNYEEADDGESNDQGTDEDDNDSSVSQRIKQWTSKSQQMNKRDSETKRQETTKSRGSSSTTTKNWKNSSDKKRSFTSQKVKADIEVIDETKPSISNDTKARMNPTLQDGAEEKSDLSRNKDTSDGPKGKVPKPNKNEAKAKDSKRQEQAAKDKKLTGKTRSGVQNFKKPFAKDISPGKVPTITVEDFSVNSSPKDIGAHASESAEDGDQAQTNNESEKNTRESTTSVETNNAKSNKPFLKSWKQKFALKKEPNTGTNNKNDKEEQKTNNDNESTDVNSTPNGSSNGLLKDEKAVNQRGDDHSSRPASSKENQNDMDSERDRAVRKETSDTKEGAQPDRPGESKVAAHHDKREVVKRDKSDTTSDGASSSAKPTVSLQEDGKKPSSFLGVSLKPVSKSKKSNPKGADKKEPLEEYAKKQEIGKFEEDKSVSRAKSDLLSRGVEKESAEPRVFTFDDPVVNTSGDVSPDIPANFGMFRTDRPSLANIYTDAEEVSQNGGTTDVNISDQSEKEEAGEDYRKYPGSRARQRSLLLNQSGSDNGVRLNANTSVVHKETSSLPDGQKFTVLAITNGDLHLEPSDEEY
ncbi:transmembrane channel-like protein [Plakobranchus ocellatus]|uniref:Transmembrane channel-like protein n=1 Tax=Plakobranchus ocellatus TaxID=259542 RepID=A0AAV3Z7D2_9GAST|nr:transmembrane channel-like protein [Plakobranchus ocellatus]